MLDRHVSHLLSSQMVVFPYLDRVAISQAANWVNNPLNSNDSVPGVCLLLHESPSGLDIPEVSEMFHTRFLSTSRCFRAFISSKYYRSSPPSSSLG